MKPKFPIKNKLPVFIVNSNDHQIPVECSENKKNLRITDSYSEKSDIKILTRLDLFDRAKHDVIINSSYKHDFDNQNNHKRLKLTHYYPVINKNTLSNGYLV